MADPTYQPLVYRKQGGNEQHVASGGIVEYESGGTLQLDAGAIVTGFPAAQKATSAGDPAGNAIVGFDILVPYTTTSGPKTDMVLPTALGKVQIVEVIATKTVLGSSATTALSVQIATSTDGAITDAINMKGIRGVTARAANITDALSVRPAGSIIRATRAGSIGSGTAGHDTTIGVRIIGFKRATT